MAAPEESRSSREEQQGQLRQNDLIRKLVPDPGQHQPLTTLVGYLGRSTREGEWRLYLTEDLNEYVEFSEQDVVHSQPLAEEQSRLSATQIWLPAETRLRHTQIISRQVQADFLRGEIASRFMQGTSPFIAGEMVPVRGAIATANYKCSVNPHIPACQGPSDICPPSKLGACGYTSAPAFCPTGVFVGCTGAPLCGLGV